MDTNEPPSDGSEATSESFDQPSAPAESLAPEPLQPIAFDFTGKTGEYFRIWIVNLLLTVVTLGIYWPWALVRSRRYFYARTKLDGHSFDYLAKPKNLLIGYAIAVILAAAYFLAGLFNPLFVFPVIIVYGIAAPWMVYKALRFRARNTMYRNVRFKFGGSLGDSYTTYLVWAFAVPFTFGLIVPFWEMKKKEYFLDNLQFGKSLFRFKPQAGEYYKWYLAFFAIGIGLYIGFIALLVGAGGFLASASYAVPGQTDLAFIIPMVATYLLIIVIMVVFQQGLWMCIFNYNMTVLDMGSLGFESRMKFWKFIGVMVSSVLASVFSLGMLVPWAKIRIAKYKLENAVVLAPGGRIGSFVEAEQDDEGALGEAATDFMDFEIGL
jgi:uncharacterized membrane protein YjgN (DUF898 family)